MNLDKTVSDLIIKSQSESFSKDEAYRFLDQARILIMEAQDKICKKPEPKPVEIKPDTCKQNYEQNYREEYYREKHHEYTYDDIWGVHYETNYRYVR